MKNDVLEVTRKTEDRWKLQLDRNGEELCRVELVRKRLRLGRSIITAGGVVGLYTPPERRLEGHARRLMEASHRFLREQGCSIALMNAISGFYNRFGYDVVFPVYRLFVETDRLLQTRRQHVVRRARAKDQPALVKLYNQCNRYRTGTLVRPGDWRFGRLIAYGRPARESVAREDSRGQVTGYTLCRPRGDRYFVQELNGRSHAYSSHWQTRSVYGPVGPDSSASTSGCRLITPSGNFAVGWVVSGRFSTTLTQRTWGACSICPGSYLNSVRHWDSGCEMRCGTQTPVSGSSRIPARQGCGSSVTGYAGSSIDTLTLRT